MSDSSSVMWKHIGLRGHSVGTFVCDTDRIVWKSALSGRDDEVGTSSVRTIPANAIAQAQFTVFGKLGYLRIQTKTTSATSSSNLKHELRFDGFPPKDFDLLKDTLQKLYQVDLQTLTISAAGTQYGLTNVKGKNLVFRHCVLDEMNEEGQEFEPRAEDEMLSLDLAEVSQCVLPGNNRNEIELQFPESDTVEAGTDQLVSIRIYIPPDPEADPADKEASTAAELLQQRIMQTANIRKTTGDVIVSFDPNKGTFLTPRGRYQIELYDYFLRMRGQKYDYKIKYDDISRLFLLPKPDEVHMAFVIALDKPIRQGQQRYQHLVLQASKDPDEIEVHLEEATLQKEYNGELQPVMRGSLANLIAKTFKIISKKKVFIPGKFANANQQACVKCAVRANEGLLYPLEKQFVFIHKPSIIVRHNEIDSVEFQRYAGGQGSTRNFDLCVNLRASVTAIGGAKEYTFSGIDRSDYQSLYNFITSKNIKIKNLESSSEFLEDVGAARNVKPVYNEDEIYGGPGGDDEEEGSEDESYDEAAAAKEEEDRAAEEGSDSEEDMDSDELGSEIDDELDSDLEEARGGKRKSKSKSKPAAKDADDDDDNDSDDSGAPKKKKAKKDKGSPKKPKAKKDPKAPKKPMSAYIFFSNVNRKRIQEKNPGIGVGETSKFLGEEWKKLSAEDKVQYELMSAKDKKRYQKDMEDYTPPAAPAAAGKAAAKKPKKDPNAPKRAMTSFFFFSNEMRPKIKAQHPELSFGEMGKKLGEMFKGLSSEEKAKYERMAKDDKTRYKDAMTTYKAKSTKASKSDDDGSDDDSDGVGAKQDDDSDDDSDES